jgi:hypothetical protein
MAPAVGAALGPSAPAAGRTSGRPCSCAGLAHNVRADESRVLQANTAGRLRGLANLGNPGRRIGLSVAAGFC